MDEQAKKVKKAQEEQIKAYTKLKRIANSAEFQDYFDYQFKTLAQKIIWAFTTGKDGDNIKNWDDFCKIRGEIVARLQPIQEVYGADVILEMLKEQLSNYYGKQVE